MVGQVSRLVYPALASEADFGFFRIAGAGLGNSLLTYFEAFLHARAQVGTLIHPAWPSLKVGPLLRREKSARFYGDLFKVPVDEHSGLRKLTSLAALRGGTWKTAMLGTAAQVRSNGRIDIVKSVDYNFTNLIYHRKLVRSRLHEISRRPLIIPPTGWGKGSYIAAHIRLGDFRPHSEVGVNIGTQNNVRLPISWYVDVLEVLRAQRPNLEIKVFSDGRESELAQVLSIPGTTLSRGGSDLDDMIALAGSSIMVGSRSTFSYWGAFLGDMPAIWYQADQLSHVLSSAPQNNIVVGPDVKSLLSKLRL